MTAIPRAIETVFKLVPDVADRIAQFEVEEFDRDDELVAAFCEELVKASETLQAGLDEDDDEKIRLAAHNTKGMGGTMGLPEISVLAQEIEISLRNNDRERSQTLATALIGWAREFVETIDG